MHELVGMNCIAALPVLEAELHSRSEARLVLRHVTGREIADLLSGGHRIDRKQSGKIAEIIERRKTGEPIQHILGHAWFMGLSIKTDREVLIPRFDTEILAQEAIRKTRKLGTLLDLCTGSGCIAVSVKKYRPDVTVIATDISEKACKLAEQNALYHEVDIKIFQGDLFNPVDDMKFDTIACNPPYIRSVDFHNLAKEIKDFEPRLALDGGLDGLEFYRRIIPGAKQYLRQGGILMLEIGDGQKMKVFEMLISKGYQDIEFLRDSAGNIRVLKASIY